MSDLIYKDSQGDLSAAQRMQDAVVVNDEVIDGDAILREMQYHPAASMDEARCNAARALAIRALLLQEANRLGIIPEPQADEAEDEARIRQLLEQEVQTPEADADNCRRFYEHNRESLRSPGEYLVSHILLPAAPDDAAARDRVESKARELIELLQQEPKRFPELAGRFSACPSKEQGGSLGWISRGQTVPEFERAIARMRAGTLRRNPLPARYGCHVIRLDERREGKQLSYEEAEPMIRDYLRESVYRKALSQYIQLLAGRAHIKGVDLGGASSPLVQ